MSVRRVEEVASVNMGGSAVDAKSVAEVASAGTGGSAVCARSVARQECVSTGRQYVQGVWWGKNLSARAVAQHETHICQSLP